MGEECLVWQMQLKSVYETYSPDTISLYLTEKYLIHN